MTSVILMNVILLEHHFTDCHSNSIILFIVILLTFILPNTILLTVILLIAIQLKTSFY
jgi:hypothetical protein